MKKPTPRNLRHLTAAAEIGFAYGFVSESNGIEGIYREPTNEELAEFDRFMALKWVTVEDMEKFVSVYQPDARLRQVKGLDVHIGLHVPPPGGPDVRTELEKILKQAVKRQPFIDKSNPDNAFWTHLAYENLHPFTDGNGRSGRMLWCWQMQPQTFKHRLTFLHQFYYQTLSQIHRFQK